MHSHLEKHMDGHRITQTLVVIMTNQGKFVALDATAGGYPYYVDNIFGAQDWSRDLSRLKRYMRTCHADELKHGWVAVEVKIDVNPILFDLSRIPLEL